eukprot:scaffold133002_cov23-Tisochrysis_lutea.AAC.1
MNAPWEWEGGGGERGEPGLCKPPGYIHRDQRGGRAIAMEGPDAICYPPHPQICIAHGLKLGIPELVQGKGVCRSAPLMV